MRKLHVGCLLVLLLALPLAAEEGSDTARSAEALEILKKVDSSIKKISAVRYRTEAKPGGAAENFVAPGKGKVVLVGWSGNSPEGFLVDVETRKLGTDEKVSLTVGGNGDMFFLIDHTNKKAYEDMDPGVLGFGGGAMQSMAMMEFVHDAPFDDELNAERVELLGTERIGDAECFKIHVAYAGGRGESTWYFAKSDYLPRRRVLHFQSPEGDGSVERTVYDLETDPKIDDSSFVMKLPEGYTRVDDFAPSQ